MLSVSCGLPRFTQNDMANVRKHIALQLHHGAIFIPEYNIPKSYEQFPDATPIDTLSASAPSPALVTQDINAAQLLLSLAMPTPEPLEHCAVQFNHEVQVQEF